MIGAQIRHPTESDAVLRTLLNHITVTGHSLEAGEQDASNRRGSQVFKRNP